MNQILLQQVGGFKKQMNTQFDLHWRNTHPAVQEQLTVVNNKTKRKRETSPKEERDGVKKLARDATREANLMEVKREIEFREQN